ncbi:DNA-binding transcriptional regulator, LysR family [Yoonia tamlensis]|uniref:DNA-binding transcriptional regulator, LysR family n=1 Tax=Yoonia tamlensis TaxID=390270 RepID=A0A1I6HAH7_9RHOB|nr:LysR family transcriptional regulator [Yoonia tamlensis]SFR51321.1 DNA-binding transcriptional regulator, LysR family [Yoonia tamlensis]
MLNATWLNTFMVLCETNHFTRAADRLGMTQPGVSQQLRKLERQVGKPLILKDGKSFSVTPVGEAVLRVCAERMEQERQLQETISADDPFSGTVRIGCSGSFATWLYPHLIEQMQQAEQLMISLEAAPQSRIESDVLDGKLDLGIVSGTTTHPRLQATKLACEELCLALPAQYGQKTMRLNDLNRLGFVAHPDGFAYADVLFAANFPQEYTGSDRLRIRTYVNQIGQILMPVANGLGYTVLPRSGVKAFAQQNNISIYPLQQAKSQELWLISRKGRSKFARIATVTDVIKQAAFALR